MSKIRAIIRSIVEILKSDDADADIKAEVTTADEPKDDVPKDDVPKDEPKDDKDTASPQDDASDAEPKEEPCRTSCEANPY